MVLPDFFLPMKDTTGRGLASMKAWIRGWSAARQPPPSSASRCPGRLQLLGVLTFMNSSSGSPNSPPSISR